MIVIGLASVIIGEAILGARTVFIATLAVILGSILYRIVVTFALRVPWLDASDLKLITAFIVIVALVLPTIQRALKQRSLARRRSLELLSASAAGKGGKQ
jgi:putative tryptophan/tyrosine transport system permease protein